MVLDYYFGENHDEHFGYEVKVTDQEYIEFFLERVFPSDKYSDSNKEAFIDGLRYMFQEFHDVLVEQVYFDRDFKKFLCEKYYDKARKKYLNG